MAKILCVSDSIDIPSGFGIQMKYVASGLAEAGHEVYAIGYAHRGLPKKIVMCPDLFPKGVVTMVPNGETKFGQPVPWRPNDLGMIGYWLQKLQPDILLTLADLWMTDFIKGLDLKGTRWIRYIPLDSEVMLPEWANQLIGTDVPVTFAKFANKLVEKSCGIKPLHISHGVNTDIFKPRPNIKQERIKEGLGDNFVILMVGRNQKRKMQPYLFKAFAKFAKDKDDVKLLCHFDLKGDVPQAKGGSPLGWNLFNLCEMLGIVDKVVRTTPIEGFQYKLDKDEHKMGKLYPLAHCHYNSGNEGFGVPAMEANASGVPNVSPKYTTGPELTNFGKCGLLCEVGDYWVHPVGAEWCIPDIDDLAKQFQYLYDNRKELEKMSKRARNYAVKNYDWRVIIPQWVELVKDVLENPPPINYKEREYGV